MQEIITELEKSTEVKSKKWNSRYYFNDVQYGKGGYIDFDKKEAEGTSARFKNAVFDILRAHGIEPEYQGNKIRW